MNNRYRWRIKLIRSRTWRAQPYTYKSFEDARRQAVQVMRDMSDYWRRVEILGPSDVLIEVFDR